ncbi:hypothetical protein SRHO_G00118930 [Serrasalmus rhombeus]
MGLFPELRRALGPGRPDGELWRHQRSDHAVVCGGRAPEDLNPALLKLLKHCLIVAAAAAAPGLQTGGVGGSDFRQFDME